MHIAIDASRAAAAQRTGTEAYSLYLTRALIAQARPQDTFRLIFRDDPPPDLFPQQSNLNHVILAQPRRLWTHLGLGPHIRRSPADVLFVPAHVLPWPGTGRTPAVVTIHDLGYEYFPEAHPPAQRAYLRTSTRHNARAARLIIADTQATADDLQRLYGTPPQKIRVAHLGVDPALSPHCPPERIAAAGARYGIEGAYLLHIGTIQPRKNLPALVEGFAAARGGLPPGLKLVLAGGKAHGWPAVEAAITRHQLQGQVIAPGYIHQADVWPLYCGAAAYVFPSLFEGFGMPLLEAMACGTPVIAAEIPALTEIAGDAAFLGRMQTPFQMAAMLTWAFDHPHHLERLRQRGLAHAAAFTWERCAQIVRAALQEAAASA